METILGWFKTRPLRFIGGLIVFFSTGLLLFLVLLDLIVGLPNPYLGIITYMLLPGFLVFGLVLVPIDAWLQRRRASRGEPAYPVIDLCNPNQRRIATFFAISSVVILVVMTVVSYKSLEYMDTTAFCGKLCHKVMIPEYTAYERSPHASVVCTQCHIGPGAPWFVRAKLSGIPQIWHYTMRDYPRPIPTPVRALRPSRDTCENCHSPKAFYGSTLNTKITYEQDQPNTRVATSQLMHVGSGGVPGSGIHSHMVNTIEYLPAVENRTEIAWVRIKRHDGSTQEFVNPMYGSKLAGLRKKEQVRTMDCIDCHNRAAHDFVPFEKLLDDGITRQEIDASLPFIKKQAMDAVGDASKAPTMAEQATVLAKIRGISSFYERTYPDIYKARRSDIEKSVKVISTTYRSAVFPHMKIGPDTYPSWRSHDGCFRCHGTLQAASPKGRDKDIPAGCDLCHTEPTTDKEPAKAPASH